MTPFTSTFEAIVEDFRTAGIDTSAPGFYDQPAFQSIEQIYPEYLNNYARFVRAKVFDAAYLNRAEQVIRIVGDILTDELVRDGREGACVDLNMMFSRMLEKQGIWNYIVKGALTVESPSKRLANFAALDFGDFAAGHAWLFAPPFDIVDLTVKQQPYESRIRRQIPQSIFEKVVTDLKIKPDDVCSRDLIQQLAFNGVPSTGAIFAAAPNLREFFPYFRPNLVRRERLVFRYVPVAVTASEGPLEKITNYPMSGRFAAQIYEESVKPALAHVQRV